MQQQQSLQQVQQQREAASRAAAAEVAQLQQQVLHLEGLVKAAEEEKRAHRREIRNYRIEAEEHNRELQALRDEHRSVDRKAKEQERTIGELTTLLTNARSRIRNERQRNEGLVGKLEVACETESSLKAELQASQEMAEEGRRQLLSLTWGLEAPPVFSGLPEATSKSSRQAGIDQQRHRETQRGSSVDLGGPQRQYSPTNTDWVDKRMQYGSKATLDPVSSLSISPLRWNDVRILRRVVPPIQPLEDSWQTALLLAMQEGYSRIMLEPAAPSEQPWGGILLESPLVNVRWFCTVRLGSKGRMHDCLPTWLSGEVAAAASFVASITLNVTSLPSINVALEKEVIEGVQLHAVPAYAFVVMTPQDIRFANAVLEIETSSAIRCVLHAATVVVGCLCYQVAVSRDAGGCSASVEVPRLLTFPFRRCGCLNLSQLCFTAGACTIHNYASSSKAMQRKLSCFLCVRRCYWIWCPLASGRRYPYAPLANAFTSCLSTNRGLEKTSSQKGQGLCVSMPQAPFPQVAIA
ncbi:hypothetical protein, conserved [Eimeria necatrix]|uniref:Uncharacterized protein n=1 Tax=Eimeria necatrix TaxID=51315 RepID=U6MX25_9EIME|nr:hypothetical protein, conserved [Eimeria necatrix]CDJ67024.1 hypothetical protein, conserved [Eimeria necatrix]